MAMTDLEYLNLAESALRAVELSCDRINDETNVDLDNQRVGGMITLSFANKSQIVVNLQKPLHEIWVAARQGGHHFKWVAGAWHDTKGQGELFALLSQFASEQAGNTLVFSPEI
jgi:CyaY protein